MEISAVLFSFTLGFTLSTLISYFLLINAALFRIGSRVFSERVPLHKRGVPRLGGIALYLTFFISVFAAYKTLGFPLASSGAKLKGIFLASTVILLCGAYDDLIKRLSYKIKFTFQILASLIIIGIGYTFTSVNMPFFGLVYFGTFGTVLAILWLLTIMNSINLLDGLDGLASGIVIIILLSLIVINLRTHNFFLLISISALAGACLGFLRYNFNVAKMFLGDSGSLFLGLILGIVGLETATKRAAFISLSVPLLTLLIPFASIAFTFSRRLLLKRNPFKPDKWHMHYRLLRVGISHKDAVLMYYTITYFFSYLGALCAFVPKKFELWMVLFGASIMIICFFWAIHLLEVRRHYRKIPTKN